MIFINRDFINIWNICFTYLIYKNRLKYVCLINKNEIIMQRLFKYAHINMCYLHVRYLWSIKIYLNNLKCI